MSLDLRRIFVSATSHDLKSYRTVVRDELNTAKMLPVIQEHFRSDYRDVIEVLRHEISRCDAVICLIGYTFGAAPPKETDTHRSYTQWEYFIARDLGKPIFLFIAQKDCPLDQSPDEPADLLQLQTDFRQQIEQGTQLWTAFSSRDGLRLRVAQLLQNLVPASSERILDIHPDGPPAYFAGRIPELQQLARAASTATPSVIAVVGVGGQGKTTLVSQWLKSESRSRFDAVFRCTAYRGGYTFDGFLDDALLFLESNAFCKAEVPEVAARCRLLIRIMQRIRVLVIIDGVERWLSGWNSGRRDLAAAERSEDRAGYYEGVDDFLTQAAGLSTGSHLLLTSRAMPRVLDNIACSVVPVDDAGHLLPLQGLDDEAAVTYLRSLGVIGADEDIVRVAREYDSHPLALTVLGGLLSNKYGGRLEKLDKVSALDSHERLFELLGEMRLNLPRRAEVERVLQVAGHCLENPSLSILSTVLEQVHSNPVSIDDLVDLAVIIAKWNLADWDGANEVLTLHPLIKQFFAAKSDVGSTIHRRLSDWYRNQPLPSSVSSMQDAKTRLLAIEHGIRAGDIASCERLCFDLFSNELSFTEWLAAWGHFATGEELLGRLAAAADGRLRCAFLTPRAAMLRKLERTAEARECLDEAICEHSRVEDTFDVKCQIASANAYSNRGSVNRLDKQYHDALNDYDRACKLVVFLAAFYAPAQQPAARTLTNRASLLQEMGVFSRALVDFNSAIALYEKLREDGEPVTVAWTLSRLNRSNLLSEMCKYPAAIQGYDEVIQTYSEMVREGREEFRPGLAHAHSMRGFTRAENGEVDRGLHDLDFAITEEEQLVRIGRTDLEAELALTHMNRSYVYGLANRWDFALQDAQRAVSLFQRLYDSGQKSVRGFLAHSLINRSEALATQGDLKSARCDRESGFSIFKEMRRGHDKEAIYIHLRKLFRAAVLLISTDPDAALLYLDEAIELGGECLARWPDSEGLRVELRRGIRLLETVQANLASVGFDENKLRTLRNASDTD